VDQAVSKSGRLVTSGEALDGPDGQDQEDSIIKSGQGGVITDRLHEAFLRSEAAATGQAKVGGFWGFRVLGCARFYVFGSLEAIEWPR
jgi:hypothetical protein